MKIKKAIILVLSLLLLALTAGCKNENQDSPVQAPENTKQEAATKYGDITDPVELEKLWQEYFYDSIATVGNTRKFSSAQEIDPLNVAMFCWRKYVAEFGKESLELANKDSTLRLFPLDTVLEYAERYFNLTGLDVSKIEAHYYDPQKRAFLFNFGSEQTRPAYNAINSWGDHLDKVTRNSDGTITAVLVRPGPLQTGRIELTKTYTLKQREDGSLYFVSGRWEYVNNHLVVLTGDYQHFDQITGFAGNTEELFLLGEVEGKLILAYTPYEKGKKAALMQVNSETMKVEKQLEISGDFTSDDVNLQGESIIIRLKDRIIVVDKTLAQSDRVLLPQTITEKINRKPRYNAKGSPDVFFGDYDVSSDQKKYVYADEIGVKLFNTTENRETLLPQQYRLPAANCWIIPITKIPGL